MGEHVVHLLRDPIPLLGDRDADLGLRELRLGRGLQLRCPVEFAERADAPAESPEQADQPEPETFRITVSVETDKAAGTP